MRKKLALLGMTSPDETPRIRENAEIQITQPARTAGTSDPGGGESASRGRLDPVHQIAEELKCFRSHWDDPKGSRIHRERFYQSVWKLTQRVAQNHLRTHDWAGDVTQDAMDITAAFCARLLQQEEKRTGVFASTERSSLQLRGYLNRTIHLGVKQYALKFRKSRREWLSFEEDAVQAAVDARSSDWLPQVLRLTKALDAARAENRKLLPDAVGTTSLDLVLRLALNRKVHGGEVKKLVSHAGVPLRTRQRREQSLRKDLRHEMEM